VLPSSIPYARSFGINHTSSTIAKFMQELLEKSNNNNNNSNDDDFRAPDYVFTDRPHSKMLKDFLLTPTFLRIAKHLVDPIPASIQ
jgi:hypothetical protein